MEAVARLAVGSYVLAIWVVQMVVAIRFGARRKEAQVTDSRLSNLSSVVYYLSVSIYLVVPVLLNFSEMAEPNALRYAGMALLVGSFGLFAWTHHVLGAHWAPTIQIQPDHELITHGPYRKVRHPMYTAFMTGAVGVALISANWMLGLVAVISFYRWFFRASREDALLGQNYGTLYKDHFATTGRFLPPVSRG